MDQNEINRYREQVQNFSKKRLVDALVREAQLRAYYQNQYYKNCDIACITDIRSEKDLLLNHGRAAEGLS